MYFMYMSVGLHAYMCIARMPCILRIQRVGVKPPGTGVTDGCELYVHGRTGTQAFRESSKCSQPQSHLSGQRQCMFLAKKNKK